VEGMFQEEYGRFHVPEHMLWMRHFPYLEDLCLLFVASTALSLMGHSDVIDFQSIYLLFVGQSVNVRQCH
jgi:hypothetical protein